MEALLRYLQPARRSQHVCLTLARAAGAAGTLIPAELLLHLWGQRTEEGKSCKVIFVGAMVKQELGAF